MPDVIIKGMEMPVCCRGCAMYDTMSCRLLRRDVYRHAAVTADRPEDCPLSPAPEWISVEEALPEAEDDSCSSCVQVTDGRGVSIAYWCNFDPGYWSYTGLEDITHWMPLPEPPKEVQSDG